MAIRMGAHVDQDAPLAAAAAFGGTLAQLFLGNPQSWKGPEILYPGGAAALKADAEAADLHLYVHAPYLINVATTNNRVRVPSRRLLQQTVDAAAQIGAQAVVVHGGHVTAADEPEAGFENWRKCVDRLNLPVPILIENTAGGANAMARRLERIDRLWDALAGSDNVGSVGFCLDTCHAHAGGEELVGLVERVKAITGRIDLIHCNDSRDGFNSGADRHANLGQGQADPDGIIAVVSEAAAPVVLETPGGPEQHLLDLAWLRERLS